jgi:predicted DNA-binding protein
MVKIGKPTQIRFEPDTLNRLIALSQQSGHSVPALVRWCVEKSLPTLAGNIERSLGDNNGTANRV